MATFAAKSTNASALIYACHYEGRGTTTFYLPTTNQLGYRTLAVVAHKLGSNGTLTVCADECALGLSDRKSTTQPYGTVALTSPFELINARGFMLVRLMG